MERVWGIRYGVESLIHCNHPHPGDYREHYRPLQFLPLDGAEWAAGVARQRYKRRPDFAARPGVYLHLEGQYKIKPFNTQQ